MYICILMLFRYITIVITIVSILITMLLYYVTSRDNPPPQSMRVEIRELAIVRLYDKERMRASGQWSVRGHHICED